MKFEPLKKIADVVLITPDVFRDHRGTFLETHRTSVLTDATGKKVDLVQGNWSSSCAWTLRGLHYQLHEPQGKLVRCVRGKIYDIAVDIRRGSATFSQWVGTWLDAVEHKAVWVPPGFAHGFLALGQGADVQYECSTYYRDDWARAIRWNDPDLGIDWPLSLAAEGGAGWPTPKTLAEPIISVKDRAAPQLRDAELPDVRRAA